MKRLLLLASLLGFGTSSLGLITVGLTAAIAQSAPFSQSPAACRAEQASYALDRWQRLDDWPSFQGNQPISPAEIAQLLQLLKAAGQSIPSTQQALQELLRIPALDEPPPCWR
ncbi:MAG: hypothetical protein HC771_04640 [Synechococcales cyanobacterium CRU_2_2]|nr:hypothetical protein [Synechococcales cyanobacterium CRU_2_2]